MNSQVVCLEPWGIHPGKADSFGAIQRTDTALRLLALTRRRPPLDATRYLLKTFAPVVLFPCIESPQEEHQVLRLPMRGSLNRLWSHSNVQGGDHCDPAS